MRYKSCQSVNCCIVEHEIQVLSISELLHCWIWDTSQYKTDITVHRCLQSKVPEYLTDCCTPVSDIASRRHLRSASQRHLTVPAYRLTTFNRRVFSVAGPTVWNSLPDSLRDLAVSSRSSFTQDWLVQAVELSAVERLAVMTALSLHWHWHNVVSDHWTVW